MMMIIASARGGRRVHRPSRSSSRRAVGRRRDLAAVGSMGERDEANYASDHGLPLPRGRARRAGVRGSASGLVAWSTPGRRDLGFDLRTCCAKIHSARERPQSTAPSQCSPFGGPGAHVWAQHSNKVPLPAPFLRCCAPTMTQKRILRCAMLAASLHCARGNAHEPTRAPTTQAAADAAADHDGPPQRQCRRDSSPRRGLRRRGVRRAGPHRGRGLARVPRRAVGPSSPSLPRGLARRAAGRRGSAGMRTPRLAQPRAPRGRLLPSRSRVRPTATLTVTTQVPPQGRQEDLRQPTPDAHQGPGFTVSKTSKTSSTPEHAARRGKLLPPPPPPRLRLD